MIQRFRLKFTRPKFRENIGKEFLRVRRECVSESCNIYLDSG